MAAGQSSRYPPDVLTASGLDADVVGADKRFKDAIGRAHKLLKDYSVPRKEFESAVRALVLNRTNP